MKIRLLKPLVSVYGQFLEGDIVVVPDRIGKNWVKAGVAESLEPKPIRKTKPKAKPAPKKRTKLPMSLRKS